MIKNKNSRIGVLSSIQANSSALSKSPSDFCIEEASNADYHDCLKPFDGLDPGKYSLVPTSVKPGVRSEYQDDHLLSSGYNTRDKIGSLSSGGSGNAKAYDRSSDWLYDNLEWFVNKFGVRT